MAASSIYTQPCFDLHRSIGGVVDRGDEARWRLMRDFRWWVCWHDVLAVRRKRWMRRWDGEMEGRWRWRLRNGVKVLLKSSEEREEEGEEVYFDAHARRSWGRGRRMHHVPDMLLGKEGLGHFFKKFCFFNWPNNKRTFVLSSSPTGPIFISRHFSPYFSHFLTFFHIYSKPTK